MSRTTKGETKRFARRLTFAFIIALLIVAGALVIAYSKGSEKGQLLYQEYLEEMMLNAYNDGYQDATKATIESGEINGFSLEGQTFKVFIEFNGEVHDYACEAGDVTRALPFQSGN